MYPQQQQGGSGGVDDVLQPVTTMATQGNYSHHTSNNNLLWQGGGGPSGMYLDYPTATESALDRLDLDSLDGASLSQMSGQSTNLSGSQAGLIHMGAV